MDLEGVRRYWTCIRRWVADDGLASGSDLDGHPFYFEPGVEFYRSVVSGEFEFGSTNKDLLCVAKVQTSADGLRWDTLFTNEDLAQTNTEVIYTGDNDGEELLMRAALFEHSTSLGLGSVKKYFKRKKFKILNYVRVVSLDEDGGGEVEVLTNRDNFDVHHCWEWEFFAFREAMGYPVACVQHGGRLVFGGTAGQPLTLWFSAVDDFFNFRTGSNTADAMVLTPSVSQQSRLVWLASSGGALLCGTTSGEIVVKSMKADVLSATSAVAEQHSNCGSSAESVVLMTTDAIMFVDRSGQRLRRLSYSLDSEFYFARDLTVFAKGVLSGGVRGMVWQRAPEPVAWVVPDEGEYGGRLMGMLYNPDQEVSAWFCWDLGGDVCGVGCAATGEAVDGLYVVVERDGVCCLEVIDWVERDYDCVGRGRLGVAFEAELRTSQMDLVDFCGVRGVLPQVWVLMDDVDLRGARCGCGAGAMQVFPQEWGDGWVKVAGVSDGQYRRALEVSVARGHGLILAGGIGRE